MLYNTVFISIYSEPDRYGRQQFSISRFSTDIGYFRNGTGYRGQHFNARLAPHIEKIEGEGLEIRYEV
jgi:hypothetical protein